MADNSHQRELCPDNAQKRKNPREMSRVTPKIEQSIKEKGDERSSLFRVVQIRAEIAPGELMNQVV